MRFESCMHSAFCGIVMLRGKIYIGKDVKIFVGKRRVKGETC